MTVLQHAIVGAAETTSLGKVPGLSQIGLHIDAALNAMADAGLKPSDIDGIATAQESPVAVAAHLGVRPRWIDGTSVGGSSFLLHLRHATAAIMAGMCTTVLITHGESGRSGIGALPLPHYPPGTPQGQFETPYGTNWAPTLFTLTAMRYLHAYGLGVDALAEVVVAQRRWAALNPRATLKDQVDVASVLADRQIAYPFTLPMCCLVSDGGGALIVTSAERAKDFAAPVYIAGSGEGCETTLISQMADYRSSRGFRDAGSQAFASAGLSPADVDHLMIYDAFAHVPLYGLEDLGFCEPGAAAGFIRDGHTSPGGKLPLNTNGGGLSYAHTGMYGMFVLQESIRQMRGIAPAQVPGAKVSFALGNGGWFMSAGAVLLTNQDRL